MWKPTGAEYDDAGKRICDNQSCTNLLSNDEYKQVSEKQKQADEKGQSRGHSKGFTQWMHCGDCGTSLKRDSGSVVYPDGFMPGTRTKDKTLASKEMRRIMTGSNRANQAEDADDDAASTSSLSSSKRSTEASKIKSMEEQALRIQLLESQKEAAELKAKIAEQRAGGDSPQPARVIRGRGKPVYQSRLQMDTVDEDEDE